MIALFFKTFIPEGEEARKGASPYIDERGNGLWG
jgi:hypothetical protein